ncbi:tudor domain-containing protein 6 [Hemicordylus capensis]|uniref:tudor domain-containing protein 6 n=1 Tax=Hemicordylus capensis TaxID=884348 RepID=UPI00230383CC|nr:tudor domain-containing protein 6 [Hemicordylus capensis]
MCSVLPSPGNSLTLRVSFVEIHPEAPLVRLWGLSGERREEYRRLTEEVQLKAGPRLAGGPGREGGRGGDALALGELCLVELGGRWQRCRVVSLQAGPGQAYRVFLLDEGRTVSAGPYYLARGPDELFHLPSEVLGCILADLVPPGRIGPTLTAASGEPKVLASLGSGVLSFSWTAGAVEFLGYLHGKEVSGLVREVLIPQRLVVLELPWLLAQMHHLGLASQISPGAFRTLLGSSLNCTDDVVVPPPERPSSPPQTAATVATRSPPVSGPLDYFYPRLELDVTEPVLVTQISDPHRVYCQLRSLSKEIQRLSGAMYQAFEATKGKDLQEALPTSGSPCAARGIDGCWYRALLLEVYPGVGPEEQPGAVAQVICVDYGRKEFVTKRNLHRLPAECFRMPVVTYPCSLQGITDGGCGWARSQISELKTLLLGKVVQARIEAYCPFEHLYYVTLYGEDGLNLNCLYGVQAQCLAQSLLYSNRGVETLDAPAEKELGSLLGTQPAVAVASLPGVHLKAGEFHNAQISFLQDPTEFWVHLQEHYQPLSHLKQNLHDFYSQSKKLEGILLAPQPGSLCCVMLKENFYHRALVTKVQGKGIEVYLVDRGSTEIVDLYKVKELLPQFRELPAVALKCALANPSSQSQSWSPDAVGYFREAVLNKELVIQALGMQGDIYIVELFDYSLAGEKNLGKIMSQGNYPEQYKDKALKPLQKVNDEPLEVSPEEQVAEENSRATQNLSLCPMQNGSEIKPGFSCEEQLDVGSTVDVVVSYTENPGLFWCQLAKKAHELKALMAEIQDYCKHSAQPHDWPNPVCLAKYSEDEKWYRALIVSAVRHTEEVDVVYVDYGNKELVSLKNLRATKSDFLKLKAQAFRCSLYNLIQPNGEDPLVWDEKSTEAFQEFMDLASKQELKCTIFALAALNNTDFVNIVDLITPFESVCCSLTRQGLARCVQPEKPLASSVHLRSFYYSTHDLKIGSEEVVYVTHVKDLSLFYCQLARSANVLRQLTSSISKLGKVRHSLQASQAAGHLYLAKYTDGYWYRAIGISAKAIKEIFFVDFGNTQLLRNEDLVVIPHDAYEILLLPMQAIKCSLADVADVTKDAVTWFEKVVLDKPLKASVVAKEPDGKLIVELYDGKMKINAMLKESLGLQHSRRVARYAEKGASVPRYSYSREASTETRKPPLKDHVKPAAEFKRLQTENLETPNCSKPSTVCRDARPFQQKAGEIGAKCSGTVERCSRNDPIVDRKGRDYALFTKREERSDNLKNRDQSEINTCSSLKKICDLPQKNISPGLKALVYASHINNPSDFYVQLVEDEPLLDRISEKLNNSKKMESLNGQQLHIGDLICAVFSEDGLWYRAVIKEKPSGESVSVQYIDYGNSAVVDTCKTCRLAEDCLSWPVMSIHCSLDGIKTTELPDWAPETVQYFSQRINEIQMNSEFVGKLKNKWEIVLYDQEGNVIVDLLNSDLADQTSLGTSDEKESVGDLINLYEAAAPVEHSISTDMPDSKSFLWKIPEVGQAVKTFSVVAKSPGCFWCRFADTAAISSIEKKLQEVGELAETSVDDIKSGCPCLARHSRDKKFYRAVVSCVEGNALRVVHIDYGTEELVSKEMIRQISDELLTIPPQAFLCCLFGFHPAEGIWTEGTNKIFSDVLVDSLLDVTVVEKQNDGLRGIPLFVVKLECQKKSICEQVKSFWKLETEASGPTLANVDNPEGQKEDVDEDSEAVLFEAEESVGIPVAAKNTAVSEDLCSELSQPMGKSLLAAGSRVSLEMHPFISSEYQARHQQDTFEALDTGHPQTMLETLNNEMVYSVSEEERDVPNSIDVCKLHLPSEMLEQDPFKILDKIERQTELLIQNTLKAQLSLGDEKGLSNLVPFEVPSSSDDTKQLLLELEMLRTHSSEAMSECESIEGNSLLCEETSKGSELGLLEVSLAEEELVVCSEVHPLQADDMEDEFPLDLPTLAPPADNEDQSSCSETELNQQDPVGNKDIVEQWGTENKTDSSVKWQSRLDKSSVEVQISHQACEGLAENTYGDVCSRSTLLDGEEVETSSSGAAESNATTCSLKGFDIGSKCMVRSGLQWYEGQILEVSAEYTKVLNLSSGDEERVNPINVWNGIPEMDSDLTETLHSKEHTLCPMPAGDLAIEGFPKDGDREAKEVACSSDDDSVCCGESSESAPE